jgi:hypothetical protein
VGQNETNGRSVLVVEDDPGIAAVCIRTPNIPVIMVTAIGFELNIKLAMILQVDGGPFGTVPELLFEKKRLIPALQQLLASPL